MILCQKVDDDMWKSIIAGNSTFMKNSKLPWEILWTALLILLIPQFQPNEYGFQYVDVKSEWTQVQTNFRAEREKDKEWEKKVSEAFDSNKQKHYFETLKHVGPISSCPKYSLGETLKANPQTNTIELLVKRDEPNTKASCEKLRAVWKLNGVPEAAQWDRDELKSAGNGLEKQPPPPPSGNGVQQASNTGGIRRKAARIKTKSHNSKNAAAKADQSSNSQSSNGNGASDDHDADQSPNSQSQHDADQSGDSDASNSDDDESSDDSTIIAESLENSVQSKSMTKGDKKYLKKQNSVWKNARFGAGGVHKI
ncbi:MAG: hypothetical protein ACPG2Y_02715, partial [Acholeplasmataceae bacterium]